MGGTFSNESLLLIEEMLYAEDPLLGKCNQKKLQKESGTSRTPEQQDADRARAQASRGKDNVPSAVRSEAAKKGAETRKRCKGSSATPPG